jgi:hypothetical protein
MFFEVHGNLCEQAIARNAIAQTVGLFQHGYGLTCSLYMFLYAAGLDVCLNGCKCKNEKKPTFSNLLQIEWWY